MVEDARIQVLIADGSGQTCEELASLLSAEPTILVVGTATDGDAAISITGRVKPDVVLIDIKIPGTSGVEATEVITALLPNTAVIMLSDEGGADLLRKAMVAGARQFLLKPVVKPSCSRRSSRSTKPRWRGASSAALSRGPACPLPTRRRHAMAI